MTRQRAVAVISMVGKSGVGKTTALEKVVAELKRRGYRVGTVKHDSHGFDIDTPGKDSWRHARAGSDVVVISGPHKLALMKALTQEMPLNEIVPLMGELDLVITEGYKSGDKPKIEVTRKERGTELLCQPDELICILTDYLVDMPVLQFDLNDAGGVVDLLEQLYLEEIKEAKR